MMNSIQRDKFTLSKNNRNKYNEFCLFVNSSNIDTEDKNKLKDEILDHLIEGEKHGKTFDDLFSENPREYSQQLIEMLPKATFKTKVSFFLNVIFISIIINIPILFFSDSASEFLFTLVTFPLLAGVLSLFCFRIFKGTVFKNSFKYIIAIILVIQLISIVYVYFKNAII